MIDYTFLRYGDAEDAITRHFLFEMVLLCIAFCTITARTDALHAQAATIFIYVHQTKVKTGLPCVGWSSLQ